MGVNIWTFYWLDGKKEVLEGITAADACNRAGYGRGAIPALDFTCKGENDFWYWDGKKWMKKEPK
jgi:hypothetical protein